jgi:hypothetical protein
MVSPFDILNDPCSSMIIYAMSVLELIVSKSVIESSLSCVVMCPYVLSVSSPHIGCSKRVFAPIGSALPL